MTETVATQLFERQPQLLGVRPLSQVAEGFVAEAFTVRLIAAREDSNPPDPYRSGAGVAVYPGDVLVADRDGIIVVPRALVAEIAEPSLEQERLAAHVSTKIHAGEPLWGNCPPGEQAVAEYKASLEESHGT